MIAWAGKHAKLLAAIFGGVSSVLSQVTGGSHWLLAVTAAGTALGVYAVPNTQGGPGARV